MAELECYKALKFASADRLRPLLVEAFAMSAGGADVPGVMPLRGTLDCASPLPEAPPPEGLDPALASFAHHFPVPAEVAASRRRLPGDGLLRGQPA